MPQVLIATNIKDLAARLMSALEGHFSCTLCESLDDLLELTARLRPEVVLLHDVFGEAALGLSGVLLERGFELGVNTLLVLASSERRERYFAAGVAHVHTDPPILSELLAQLIAAERDGVRIRVLEQAEQARTDLTHMLVHDLKNPVSAVIGLLDVVLDDYAEALPESVTMLLQLAYEEAHHLLHLTANILDVRRMREGKLTLTLEPFGAHELRGLLERTLRDVGTALGERVLEIVIPDDLPRVHADLAILRRVFTNLLSNAVKHTGRGGQITVVARVRLEDPVGLEISVRDDGEGIPAEDLERIFGPFEQSPMTQREPFDTGLGLTFCKLAVERHGGRIWIESKRGLGTQAYFTLPYR